MMFRFGLVIWHQEPEIAANSTIGAGLVNICSVREKNVWVLINMFGIPFSSRVIGYAFDAVNGRKGIGEGTLAL
jgi:hypothetical protein